MCELMAKVYIFKKSNNNVLSLKQ